MAPTYKIKSPYCLYGTFNGLKKNAKNNSKIAVFFPFPHKK